MAPEFETTWTTALHSENGLCLGFGPADVPGCVAMIRGAQGCETMIRGAQGRKLGMREGNR